MTCCPKNPLGFVAQNTNLGCCVEDSSWQKMGFGEDVGVSKIYATATTLCERLGSNFRFMWKNTPHLGGISYEI